MFKRLLLILMAVLILTGCMPAPIDKKQTVVPEPEKSMVTRSLSAVGNTFRINKKLKLAKKGEPMVVAYVGSSIFYDKSENSVSDLSFEYIKTFLGKKAHLKKITSGVEDSTSILGNILLKRDVLSKKPDIIFLDYAVFDTPNQDCREAFEAIIRNSLACENEPQVVILLNTNSDGSYKQDFMEQVGRYYNLPIINVVRIEFKGKRKVARVCHIFDFVWEIFVFGFASEIRTVVNRLNILRIQKLDIVRSRVSVHHLRNDIRFVLFVF